jgi:uncharacterized membrane protein YdbT with pleckstrin-like domain
MAVEDQLQPGEEVLYRAHPTRIALALPLAVAVLVAVGGFVAWQAGDNLVLPLLAGVVALVCLAIAGWKLFVLNSFEYVLTNRRMIRHWGILTKSSVDSYLDKINNVEHRQTLWGRLLNYGDVEVDTASETGATVFRSIAHPLELKRQLLAAVDAYRATRGGFAAPAPAAGPSAAERLRQAKKLLDDGLITEAEYEAKRRQLLEEM